ncbi:MAG: histidine phosphatase family protein [Ilumatobacteraceae bacterium]
MCRRSCGRERPPLRSSASSVGRSGSRLGSKRSAIRKWHGTPAEQAEQAFREQRNRPAKDQWRGLDHLGGEHVGEFVARVREGCGLFLAERGIHPVSEEFAVWSVPDPDLKLGLVAHAGTNAVIICHLLGLQPTPWEWDRFVLNHASITRLRSIAVGEGHTFALTRLSDVEHLEAGDRTQ